MTIWDGTSWKTTWSDTGWVEVSPASGFTASPAIKLRRIGSVVYVQGRVTRTAGNFDTTTTYNVVDNNVIPATFRPSSFAHSATPVTNGGNCFGWANINANGGLELGIRSAAGNNVFLSSLSGYLVD